MKYIISSILILFSVLFIPIHSNAKFALSNLHMTNDLSLKTLDGKIVKLSEMTGKPVILNFFTTWCPACKEEIPELIRFQSKYGKQINFYSINYTTFEIGKVEKVKSFVKKNNINFPILLDNYGEVGKKYEVITIPSTFFIDSKGVLVKKIVGPVSFDMLEEFVLENK